MFLHSVSRFEEREAELKKEFNALHQRHTEVRSWSFLTIKIMYSCKMEKKKMSLGNFNTFIIGLV